ncbi:MAG TPA: choice-of-anchor D domain-containing protein [Acidimicrobiales bacterium]
MAGTLDGTLPVVGVDRWATKSHPSTSPDQGPAYFDSEAGDSLGAGREIGFSNVAYTGLRRGYPTFRVANGQDEFHLMFAAAAGSPLVPGTYDDAQRFDVRAAGHPGLDISGDGRGCDVVSGRFIVDDATYDAGGKPLTFAVRFEEHCEGAAAALFGFLDYHAPTPYPTRTVSPNTLSFESTGGPVTQSVTLTNDGPMSDTPADFSISGANPSSFAIAGTTCSAALAAGASCSISISYTPQGSDPAAQATLRFADELAPLGPPGETAGAGQGRSVALAGISSSAHVPCTFNGTTDETPVADVTPGSSISISCTGFQPFDTVVAGEGSPLFVTSDSESDLDPNLQSFTADGSGALHATFVVPEPFEAPDPDAVCPPSDSQINAGYLRCFLALADSSGMGDVVALDYGLPPVTGPSGGSTGYWMVGSDGGVFAFGGAGFEGSLPGMGVHVNDIVAVVPTADGGGYWMVGSDGGVFAFGDAAFVGSLPGIGVHVHNIVGAVPTADGAGYWMVGSDGGVFAFGDAGYAGSLPGLGVHVADVKAVVPTADGGGYWMVGSDGGVFAFGDAGFAGSLPGLGAHVNNIVAAVPTADGGGYWMVGSDGGVFAFGDASFLGSLPGLGAQVDDIRGVVSTADGGGYWMVGSDGGVFSFGDAGFVGSLPALDLRVNDIVGITPT